LFDIDEHHFTPENLLSSYDVIIIGAGAAGLMCAIEAGKRGRSVLVLEHNRQAGEKILISGGGRCNFTNLNTGAENFVSGNPHFCKSALSRFSASDFIALVEKHSIAYHEKKLGQLFCDGKSQQIIDLLLRECAEANVELRTGCEVTGLSKGTRFEVATSADSLSAESIVIAAGGLSIPQLGATNFAFAVARQFGLSVTKLKPGLVPLTFGSEDLRFFGKLAGISVDSIVTCSGQSFRENILFTHRGLSGPGVLQASSYWDEGEVLSVNLLPDADASAVLRDQHQSTKELVKVLDQHLPRRFAIEWCDRLGGSRPMQRYSLKDLEDVSRGLQNWKISPDGTEGFGKAEVTVGGVDRSEERRVGKECDVMCRSRWSPYH
jgi:predicted Rossmann fold flavoprotein